MIYKSDIPPHPHTHTMAGSQASTTAEVRQPLVNSTWKTRLEHGKGAKARMREKQPLGAFAVAVDYRCRDGKVSKSFTFFDSPSDLFQQTACMVQKNFYELIEPDRWTKLYLDIEHYVNADENAAPSRVDTAIAVVQEALLQNWRSAFEAKSGAIDDVIVLTASRDVGEAGRGGKYKHSYHVIFRQVYFYGNTGLMKRLVNSLQGDPRLQAQGKTGEPICMVDGNVYHTDQPFRLVQSCKLVDGPPRGVLRPNYESQAWGIPELLRSVVTHDEGGGVRISEDGSSELDKEGRQVVRRKRASPDGAWRAPKRLKGPSRPAPYVGDLQQMLEQAGIQQCDVTGDVLQKNGYDVVQLRNSGPRPCILSPGVVHDNNNGFLLVNDNRVVFKCLSDKCKGKRKCLGTPPESWRAYCRGSGVESRLVEDGPPQARGSDVETDLPTLVTDGPSQAQGVEPRLVEDGPPQAQGEGRGKAPALETDLRGSDVETDLPTLVPDGPSQAQGERVEDGLLGRGKAPALGTDLQDPALETNLRSPGMDPTLVTDGPSEVSTPLVLPKHGGDAAAANSYTSFALLLRLSHSFVPRKRRRQGENETR